MTPHPLCNKFPLQSGTMVVAILNMAGGSFILLMGLMMLAVGVKADSGERSGADTAKTVVIVIALFLVFFAGVSIGLSCILYKGAKTKNIRSCQIWLIFAILGMICMILQMFFGSSTVIGTFVGLIFQGYCLWLVWAFIQEIKMEQESGGGCISGP